MRNRKKTDSKLCHTRSFAPLQICLRKSKRRDRYAKLSAGVPTKSFYIKTFGCQMNMADSAYMEGMLEGAGYLRTNRVKDADIVLFNTCSVRDHADNRAVASFESLKNLKNGNSPIFIFAGCVAERLGKRLFDVFEHLDIGLGPGQFSRLVECIDKKQNNPSLKINATGKIAHSPQPIAHSHIKKARITCFVPIMRGCDNFCSFCIVPFVRGREVSRDNNEIINEIEHLVSHGTREVTLLGQNVNSYYDKMSSINFAGLLSKIDNIPNLERIRFITSHPKDATDEFINAVKNGKRICEHFHLPLQSGSNKILKRMNRKYTRNDYLKIAMKIRKAMPQASITTDLIVGFPGENQEDFKDTIDMVKQVKFDSSFTFKYSPRPGTKASGFKDDVTLTEKKKRLSILNNACEEVAREQNSKYIGRDIEVLVESYTAKDRTLMGRTRTFKSVFFKGPSDLIGKLLFIRITSGSNYSLKGRILS